MSRYNQRNVARTAARRHAAHRHHPETRRPQTHAPEYPSVIPTARSGGSSTVTIGQFLLTLRRRVVLVTVCVLLGLAASIGFFSTTPKTYQATAVVDISPILGNQNGNANANSVSTITESKIATSSSVALTAAHTLGYVGTFDGLVQHVAVSSPLSSQVLNITFSASSAQRAAAGANAFANAYLSYRTSTGEDQLKLRIARVNDQIAQVQASMAKLKVPSNGPNDPQYVSQQSLLHNQLEQLQTQANGYRTSVITPGQVAGAASAPASPSSPKLALYLAGGLLVGLMAGAILAMVRDRRDDRVRSAADLEDTVGAPVIAEISVARSGKHGPRLVALTSPHSPEADAYRSVTTTVTASSADRRVVLIGGAGREGHSLTPMNLAVTFALQGLNTVIAGPAGALTSAQALLDLPTSARTDAPRLTERLVRSTAVSGLSVLSLGTEVSLSATLRANGDNLDDVLARADIVVLDGLNAELPSTTMRLGQIADEAVIVSYCDQTKHVDVERLAHQLSQVRSALVGAVLLDHQKGAFTRLSRWRHRESAETAELPVSTAHSVKSGNRDTAKSAAAEPTAAADRSQDAESTVTASGPHLHTRAAGSDHGSSSNQTRTTGRRAADHGSDDSRDATTLDTLSNFSATPRRN